MKSETKNRILKAGARIMLEHGFNHTGLQEVLQAAEVPKGSFYFYFQSKEDFGLQCIGYYAENFFARADRFLQDPARPPLQRLRRFFSWLAEAFAKSHYKGG